MSVLPLSLEPDSAVFRYALVWPFGVSRANKLKWEPQLVCFFLSFFISGPNSLSLAQISSSFTCLKLSSVTITSGVSGGAKMKVRTGQGAP